MLYKAVMKRIIDLIISISLLLLLFPMLLIISISLFILNDGKPFFFQIRPGKKEKLFRIIKFKTMNDRRDSYGNLLSDVERLTTVGKLIRKTSLDEIPQLINILKGEMSLIGPRPLLTEYLPLYNIQQKLRHEVRPGITGWAQINGRNAISWQQKLEYDVWYVENISLSLDIKIAFLTIKKVLRSEGINSTATATMEKFTGNQ
jgi:lipopolysaccharide/colanic/teichoic acid biosynthesis glycosyltransferase